MKIKFTVSSQQLEYKVELKNVHDFFVFGMFLFCWSFNKNVQRASIQFNECKKSNNLL